MKPGATEYRFGFFGFLPFLACVTFLAWLKSDKDSSFAHIREVLEKACEAFSSYDHNGDGVIEIERLSRIRDEQGRGYPYEFRPGYTRRKAF